MIQNWNDYIVRWSQDCQYIKSIKLSALADDTLPCRLVCLSIIYDENIYCGKIFVLLILREKLKYLPQVCLCVAYAVLCTIFKRYVKLKKILLTYTLHIYIHRLGVYIYIWFEKKMWENIRLHTHVNVPFIYSYILWYVAYMINVFNIILCQYRFLKM